MARATGALLAKAEESMSASAAGRQAATREFLTARIARLRSAAGRAVSAARGGDVVALRSCLRQFDALNSALWEVYEAVAVPPQASRARTAAVPPARAGELGTGVSPVTRFSGRRKPVRLPHAAA